MGLIELVLLAIGVSMDAFAVSICKGIETRKATYKEILLCGIWFGGFQGLMPFIGYALGSRFEFIISRVAPWLAFVLLAVIGINMLRESFSSEEEETKPGFGFKSLLLLAVATSVDALAVGITFVAVPVNVLNTSSFVNTIFACVLIIVTTGAFSMLGVHVGNIFGSRYKSGAEAVGGFVLLFIGLKILLESLGVVEFMNDGDVLFGLLIPFAGTILGSALVFVISDKISDSFRNILTGMAGGIMLACAIWSLLTPTIVSGRLLTAFIGFLIGIGFQYALDKTVPHTHVFTDVEEGPSSKLGHIWKVVLSETIHHVPEGIAVGAMYAGVLTSTHEVTLAAAVALAVGIAIQNMPEGAFVSSPINAEGEQKSKSFLMGVVSGVVEPLLGIATIIVVGVFPGTLSFIMSLASGAIVFLVIEESIPSMFTGKYSDKGTLSLAVSFALMMLLTFIAGGSAL